MKICYVGQRLYFAKQVNHDAMWMELAPNVGNWADLLSVQADIFVFFMPHQVPRDIRNRLGTVVGVHAEPLPKFINGEYITSKDVTSRLSQLKTAFDLEHFYHHDKTSFPVLEREGLHPKEFISAIATDKFYPEEREKKWDLIFYGRETQHRLDIMLQAKHQFGNRFLHIAHGIMGDELNRLQNMAKIGINCHTEEIPALENRIQVEMASGLFVLSEPLSHNDFFKPREHFIEFRSADELIQKARYYLEHEEEREAIARAGYDLVTKRLAAKVVWPKLVKEVLI